MVGLWTRRGPVRPPGARSVVLRPQWPVLLAALLAVGAALSCQALESRAAEPEVLDVEVRRVLGASVEVVGVNASWCLGDERNRSVEISYEAVVLTLRLSGPPRVNHRPARRCAHLFGELGRLNLSSWVAPLTFPVDVDAAGIPVPPFPSELVDHPASFHAVRRTPSPVWLPVCDYDDPGLARWLAALGVAAPRRSSEMRAVLLTGHSAPAPSRTRARVPGGGTPWNQLVPLSLFDAGASVGVKWAGRPGWEAAAQLRARPRPRPPTAVSLCSDCAYDHLEADAEAAAAAERNRSGSASSGGTAAAPGAGAVLQVPGSILGSDASEDPQVLFEETLRLGIPFASKVIGPLCNPVLENAASTVLTNTATHVLEPTGQVMSSEASTDVPPHVTAMLLQTVPYNITNILQDSLTYALSERLTTSLAASITPFLSERVPEAIVPTISANVQRSLTQSVPVQINRNMPSVVDRTLLWRLLHSITRSVTHAVTAAVAGSLSPSDETIDKFCRDCYYYHALCGLCQFSREGQYYISYHSAYFSDYYANYYTEYYGKAVELVDTAEGD